jgi:hypothetical protein
VTPFPQHSPSAECPGTGIGIASSAPALTHKQRKDKLANPQHLSPPQKPSTSPQTPSPSSTNNGCKCRQLVRGASPLLPREERPAINARRSVLTAGAQLASKLQAAGPPAGGGYPPQQQQQQQPGASYPPPQGGQPQRQGGYVSLFFLPRRPGRVTDGRNSQDSQATKLTPELLRLVVAGVAS